MQFKYLFCHLLIASWFIRAGRSQQNKDTNAPWTETAGTYLIYSCGSKTDTIRALLDQTITSLQEAVASTQSTAILGNNPYKAFFRDVDPSSVTGVFSKIIAGARISIQNVPYRPTIVCVNDQRPGLKEQWDRCQMYQAKALWSDKSQFLYLCPAFSILKTLPDSGDCGSLVARSSQLQGSRIAYTQYTMLVYELVHMYLETAYLQPEKHNVNVAMGLASTSAVANPSNYAFYAGYIRAGCSHFPTKQYRSGNRQLVGDNSDIFRGEVFVPHAGCASNPVYVAFGMCTKPANGNSHH